MFNLGELVHSPDTEVALAVAPDLTAETVGHSNHAQRHLLFGDGFVHVHRGEGVLGRSDHVVLVGLDAVHDGLEITEVGDAFVGFSVHHHRRLNEGVGPLSKEFNGVLLERKFQSGKIAFEEIETAAGYFGSSLEVNPSIHVDELVVRPRVKVEHRLGTVNGMDRVARFIVAHGDVFVKDVGDGHAQAVTLGHGLVTEVGHLGQYGLSGLVVTRFFCGANATCGLVF